MTIIAEWPSTVLDHWRQAAPPQDGKPAMTEEMRENFEERAAILEYCAGMTRSEAVAHALASILL